MKAHSTEKTRRDAHNKTERGGTKDLANPSIRDRLTPVVHLMEHPLPPRQDLVAHVSRQPIKGREALRIEKESSERGRTQTARTRSPWQLEMPCSPMENKRDLRRTYLSFYGWRLKTEEKKKDIYRDRMRARVAQAGAASEDERLRVAPSARRRVRSGSCRAEAIRPMPPYKYE